MRWIRGRRRPVGVGRPEARPAFVFLALLALTLGLAACADEPTRPNARAADEDEGRTPPRPLGLVEITISGLGTGQVTSSALSAPTVDELERIRAVASSGAAAGLAPQDFNLPAHAGDGDGTIQLELLSTGSFTEGVRGNGGHRYLYATYRVRNAQSDGTPYDTPRKNLTFYAVSTTNTLDHTAISNLRRFDGSAADPTLAAQLIPTGAVAKDATTDSIVAINPDVLQALTEEEADAIRALAGEGVVDVFPYGFVVRRRGSTTTRELPANPEPEQFDGIVTFAFKAPLQASPAQDPFTVSAMFLAVDDDEVKITQSVEEQTAAARAAFEARAASLGASRVTLLPGRSFRAGNATRLICSVRTAGPAETPAGYLVNAQPPTWMSLSPDPYAADGSGSFIARNVQLQVSADVTLDEASPQTLVVRGMQSGPRFTGVAYEGNGTSTVRTPAANFFPGEEAEVVLRPELVECPVDRPGVVRYRVAPTGGSGTFVVDTTYSLVQSIFPTSGPWSLALGDLDRDGDLDVVVPTSAGVSILVNDGAGNFALERTFTPSANHVALGDVDGDGDLDLVTASAETIRVWSNDGAGTFDLADSFTVSGSVHALALGDVDGDGDLDLVVVNGTSYSTTLTVFLNQ